MEDEIRQSVDRGVAAPSLPGWCPDDRWIRIDAVFEQMRCNADLDELDFSRTLADDADSGHKATPTGILSHISDNR